MNGVGIKLRDWLPIILTTLGLAFGGATLVFKTTASADVDHDAIEDKIATEREINVQQVEQIKNHAEKFSDIKDALHVLNRNIRRGARQAVQRGMEDIPE